MVTTPCWTSQARSDEALLFHSVERRVKGARGWLAIRAVADFFTDSHAVCAITQAQDRKENHLFEFAECGYSDTHVTRLGVAPFVICATSKASGLPAVSTEPTQGRQPSRRQLHSTHFVTHASNGVVKADWLQSSCLRATCI
jgi:hypothetical protein